MTINANAKMAINGNTKITTNGNAKVATNGNAKTTTNGNAKSIYILNSGAAETEHDRLNVQHHLFSDIMQGDLLPPHIASGLKASRPAPKVLEIATGTGIWLTEMAKTLSPDAELVGLDFDTSKFPSQSFLPPNVTLRQANMYEPFPSDLHGRFDVVHVRLIIFALKEGQGTDLLLTCIEPPSPVWSKVQMIHYKFAKKVGRDLNLPIGMVHYIREAGCVECDDKAYAGNSQLYTGKKKDWIARSNDQIQAFTLSTLQGIVSLGGVEGMTTQQEADELIAEAEKEFGDHKIHYLFMRAWGKKPETS